MNERPDECHQQCGTYERVKLILSLNSYPGVKRWNYLHHEMSKCIEERGQNN